MTLKTVAAVVAFWVLQIIANLLFKWGSQSAGRWAWGFFGGHLFGVTSIIFVMILYKTMHPNIAQGLCFGGAFLMVQLALALAFRASLTPVQYVGIAAITLGMFLLALGKSAPS